MRAKTTSFQEYVVSDLLRDVPSLAIRRMFSGYGVYQGGVMFGLMSRDILYFKVDEQHRQQFERFDSRPFSYQCQGKQTKLISFWEVPADILEDRIALEEWAEAAIVAARREKAAKEAKKSQPKRGFNGIKEKFHQLSVKDKSVLLRDLYRMSPDTKALLENRLLGVVSNKQQYIDEMKRETIEKIYRKGVPGDPSGRAVNSIINRARKAGVDSGTMLVLEWLAYRGFQEYLHEFGGGPETFDQMACKHLESYLQLVRDVITDETEKRRRYAEVAKHVLDHDNMITDYAEDTFEGVVSVRPSEAKDW